MKKISALLIILFLAPVTYAQSPPSLEWVRGIGGPQDDSGDYIDVDNDGNVYMTGYFQGTTDLDPGTGQQEVTSDGFSDIYVSKFNPAGNFVWGRHITGDSSELPSGIAVNGAGEIIITGAFIGTADFDPGTGVNEITSESGNLYMVKFDNDGNLMWVNTIEAGMNVPCFLKFDDQDNIYFSGIFYGTCDFDFGSGVSELTADTRTIFISKYDPDGQLAWVKTIDCDYWEFLNSMTLDPAGNIYLTGNFMGTMDFDPSPVTDYSLSTESNNYDTYIAKLSNSGDFISAIRFEEALILGSDIAVDPNGNIYFSGSFSSLTDLDPGPQLLVHGNSSMGSLCIVKMNPAFELIRATSVRCSQTQMKVNDTFMDDWGHIYQVGTFTGTTDFDQGPGTYNLSSSPNMSTSFILKSDGDGNFIYADIVNSTANNRAFAARLDNSGAIYISGFYNATADFGFGAASVEMTSNGSQDAYLMKLQQNDLGIEENKDAESLIYPNPVENELHIKRASAENATIEISNILGETIISTPVTKTFNTILLHEIPAGVYILKVIQNGQIIQSTKLVKR